MSTGLVKYDEMIRAVSECYAVDEVKNIRDQAKALEAYAAQANNIEAERKAIEIRLRAERKCGELIRQQQQSGELATPGKDKSNVDQHDIKTLSDIGISRDQSSKFQKLADIPEKDFEQALSEQATEKPSTSAIIKRFEPVKETPQVSKLSVELWGWAGDVERSEMFSRDPNELIEGMTDTMRKRFFSHLPQIINYINKIEVSKWEEKSTA